jgi:hypothetical protein
MAYVNFMINNGLCKFFAPIPQAFETSVASQQPVQLQATNATNNACKASLTSLKDLYRKENLH